MQARSSNARPGDLFTAADDGNSIAAPKPVVDEPGPAKAGSAAKDTGSATAPAPRDYFDTFFLAAPANT